MTLYKGSTEVWKLELYDVLGTNEKITWEWMDNACLVLHLEREHIMYKIVEFETAYQYDFGIILLFSTNLSRHP